MLPFSRKLSVLPPQLVSLASKNPAALSVQMTYLLHPDFCLHKPAGHTRERRSTHWLCRAVTGALGFLPPAAACLLSNPPDSLPQTPLPTTSSAAVDVTSQNQKLGSPRVQLTVLWKLTPTRSASLTGAVPATAPPGHQNGYTSCPGSILLTGLPKLHFILPSLCCKDPFP